MWNNLPYSKELMKLGCLQPSKIMFDLLNFFWLVDRRLTLFSIFDKLYFSCGETR